MNELANRLERAQHERIRARGRIGEAWTEAEGDLAEAITEIERLEQLMDQRAEIFNSVQVEFSELGKSFKELRHIIEQLEEQQAKEREVMALNVGTAAVEADKLRRVVKQMREALPEHCPTCNGDHVWSETQKAALAAADEVLNG